MSTWRGRRLIGFSMGLLMTLSAAMAVAKQDRGAIDDARLLHAAHEPKNWLIGGGTYQGWHYSTLNQINTQTVANLKPAWFFELDTYRSQQSEPVVVDGVMYLSTAWSKVYALDAATGKSLWFYDPQVPGEKAVDACCDVSNRGVAVYRGKVYVAALDGRLIALDARNGNEIWSQRTFDPQQSYVITGAPRVVKGKVIIGNSGAEFMVRGYVSAYDSETGKLVWRFYTVPGDPASGPDGAASDETLAKVALPTWSGDWYQYGGGGTAWNAIDYDPELNQLYIGTGNGSPWNRQFRSAGKGDNLFLCSIIALNPDTGKYLWHYQINPGESWDYNAVMPMIQASLKIAGKTRKVLMQAPKNGFFYVIDRVTGKLLSAQPFVAGITWAARIDLQTGRPVEADGVRFENGPFELSPAPSGAHNWHPMAYSPQTGWVYFSANESTAILDGEKSFKPLGKGADNVGVVSRFQPTRKRYLLAWDPVANKEVWRFDQPVGVYPGGVLATAGGLIFQGSGAVTGELAAYRADNGQRVWSQHLPNAPLPAPVTYTIHGEQYIAVLTGARGAGGGAGGPQALARQFGRVAVFKLGGTAAVPADPALAAPANPPPVTQQWSSADVAKGEAWYGRLCGRCHGPETNSANVIPDLRRSVALPDRDLWKAIVLEGVFKHVGMVSWSRLLSPADAEAIRGYVAEKSRQLQQIERGAVVPQMAKTFNGVEQ